MQDIELSHLYLLHRLGLDTRPNLTGIEATTFHQFMEPLYGPHVLFLLSNCIRLVATLFGHSLIVHIVLHGLLCVIYVLLCILAGPFSVGYPGGYPQTQSSYWEIGSRMRTRHISGYVISSKMAQYALIDILTAHDWQLSGITTFCYIISFPWPFHDSSFTQLTNLYYILSTSHHTHTCLGGSLGL